MAVESEKLKSSNSNSDDLHYFLSWLNYREVSWIKFQNGGEKPLESKAILSLKYNILIKNKEARYESTL